MSEKKQILLTLPDNLLCEIEKFAADLKVDRCDFIKKGTAFYIKHLKSERIKEALIKGYKEAGPINIEIADKCLQADNLQLENYVEMLSECEK